MKLIKLLYLLLFLFAPNFKGYAECFIHGKTTECNSHCKHEEHITTKANSQIVYVCTGSYAYAYHSRPNCPGLGNCKGDIKYTDENYAVMD